MSGSSTRRRSMRAAARSKDTPMAPSFLEAHSSTTPPDPLFTPSALISSDILREIVQRITSEAFGQIVRIAQAKTEDTPAKQYTRRQKGRKARVTQFQGHSEPLPADQNKGVYVKAIDSKAVCVADELPTRSHVDSTPKRTSQGDLASSRCSDNIPDEMLHVYCQDNMAEMPSRKKRKYTTQEQRGVNAMRKIGACERCKKARRKCHPSHKHGWGPGDLGSLDHDCDGRPNFQASEATAQLSVESSDRTLKPGFNGAFQHGHTRLVLTEGLPSVDPQAPSQFFLQLNQLPSTPHLRPVRRITPEILELCAGPENQRPSMLNLGIHSPEKAQPKSSEYRKIYGRNRDHTSANDIRFLQPFLLSLSSQRPTPLFDSTRDPCPFAENSCNDLEDFENQGLSFPDPGEPTSAIYEGERIRSIPTPYHNQDGSIINIWPTQSSSTGSQSGIYESISRRAPESDVRWACNDPGTHHVSDGQVSATSNPSDFRYTYQDFQRSGSRPQAAQKIICSQRGPLTPVDVPELEYDTSSEQVTPSRPPVTRRINLSREYPSAQLMPPNGTPGSELQLSPKQTPFPQFASGFSGAEGWTRYIQADQ